MMTRGCLAGSGSAFVINSRTIHGMFPSPNSTKPKFIASGFSSDQPKCNYGGVPDFESSSAIDANVWAIDAHFVTRMMKRPSSSVTSMIGE